MHSRFIAVRYLISANEAPSPLEVDAERIA